MHKRGLLQHQSRFLKAVRTQALIKGSSGIVGAIVGATVGGETGAAVTGDAVGGGGETGATVGREGATPLGALGAVGVGPVGAVGATPVGAVGVLGALGFLFGLHVGFWTIWLDAGTNRKAKIKARRMVADCGSVTRLANLQIMRVLAVLWIALLRRMPGLAASKYILQR